MEHAWRIPVRTELVLCGPWLDTNITVRAAETQAEPCIRPESPDGEEAPEPIDDLGLCCSTQKPMSSRRDRIRQVYQKWEETETMELRDTREIPTPFVTISTAEFNEIAELAVSVANGIVLECASQSSAAGKPVSIEALEPALKLRDMMKRIKERCISEWEVC